MFTDIQKNNTKLIKFNNDLDNLKKFIIEFKEIFELYKTVNLEYKNDVISIIKKRGIHIIINKKTEIIEKIKDLQIKSEESATALVHIKNINRKIAELEFSDIHL